MSRKQYGKIKGPKTPEQMKKRQKVSTAIIGGCAVLAMVGFVVIPKIMMGGANTKPQVNVTEVTKGDITSTLDVSGKVISLNTKTFFSPVNANIKDYNLKVGQLVKRGDTMVSFETDTLEKDNQKAQFTANSTIKNNQDLLEKEQNTLNDAAVASQNVNIIQGDIDNFQSYIDELNELIANRTQELSQDAVEGATEAMQSTQQQIAALNKALTSATSKETLEETNRQLQDNIEDYRLEIEKAKAAYPNNYQGVVSTYENYIAKDENTIKNNKVKIEKAKNKMGDYAKMSADQIKTELDALTSSGGTAGSSDPSADAQIAQWQLDLQDAQSTLAELQGDLASEEAKSDAGDTAAMTQAAKEAMNSSNNLAELETYTVEELLEKGRKGIQADFNGIITKADLTPGAAVTQGLELVTLASNEQVAVQATVSKYDFDKLKEGQKATLTIGNNEYNGTVSSISRVAQDNEKGTPVISCEITIDNPDDNIYLGVEAKGKITVASETGVLLIPMEAVNTETDDVFCYVLENGVVTRKSVETGVSSSDQTVVVSGLQEGDQVIPTLTADITEGMEVDGISGADAASAAAGVAGDIQAEE